MGTASTIRAFELSPCVMRKDDPAWRFALGASPTTEGHVLALTAEDGTVGYGYAAATAHMGSILGSIVTGLALGLIEGLTKVYYPQFSDTVVFMIMAIVLMIRPAGLFGKEK